MKVSLNTKQLLLSVILLRGLDTLTSEESVQIYLRRLGAFQIKRLRIGRDQLTNTSRLNFSSLLTKNILQRKLQFSMQLLKISERYSVIKIIDFF